MIWSSGAFALLDPVSGHFLVSVLLDLSAPFDIIDYSLLLEVFGFQPSSILAVLCHWMLHFRNFFHWFHLILTTYRTCSSPGIFSPMDISSLCTLSRDVPSLFSSCYLPTTEPGDRVDILFILLFSIQIILLSSLKFSSFESHVIRFYLLQPLSITVDCISGVFSTMTSEVYYLWRCAKLQRERRPARD